MERMDKTVVIERVALVNAPLPFIISVGAYEIAPGAHTLPRGHIDFPGIPPLFLAPAPSPLPRFLRALFGGFGVLASGG